MISSDWIGLSQNRVIVFSIILDAMIRFFYIVIKSDNARFLSSKYLTQDRGKD